MNQTVERDTKGAMKVASQEQTEKAVREAFPEQGTKEWEAFVQPSLDDMLDQDVSAWMPEVGDKLTGVLLDMSVATSEYGDYPLLEVQKADGTIVNVHGFHTVLRNEIARRNPSPGDMIGIKYRGVPEGENYENYRFVVRRHTV